MNVIDRIERGEITVYDIADCPKDWNELLRLARIGAAMEKFERLADPNRTSIVPVGSGQVGLYHAICYDDETIMTGGTLVEVIDKYERWIKLQGDEK